MSTLHPDSELMDLLDRIAAQDDSALKKLYERTSSQLFGLALRIVRNRDAAEETAAFMPMLRYLVSPQPLHAVVSAETYARALAHAKAQDKLASEAELSDFLKNVRCWIYKVKNYYEMVLFDTAIH